jgi:hypothetical protein
MSSFDKHEQIDHRHPEVQEDLLSWGKWILEVRPWLNT